MYYLYSLSSSANSNDIRYIGYTVNITSRLKEHLKDATRTKINTHKKNWLKNQLEQGNNIILNILDIAYTIEQAWQKEIDLIKLYKTLGYKLTNGTLGGDGVKATQEVRTKISNSNKGKTHTLESKLKMSLSKKGIKLSIEHIQKIKDTRVKKVKEPKLVQSRKGISMNGTMVFQYLENVLVQKYKSITEATKITGINNIHRCAMGLRKTAGGYNWKFKNK